VRIVLGHLQHAASSVNKQQPRIERTTLKLSTIEVGLVGTEQIELARISV
jgi:hypothetical protein